MGLLVFLLSCTLAATVSGMPAYPLADLLDYDGEIKATRTELFRQWAFLISANEATPIKFPYAMQQALSLLYRHVFEDIKQSPIRQMSRLLAASIAGREGYDVIPDTLKNILATSNPNILSGIDTMAASIEKLHLHSATKMKGDPFMDSVEGMARIYCFTRGPCKRGHERSWYRPLMAQLLMVLATRSEALINLFSTTIIDLSSPGCAGPLYEYCFAHNSIFPGRKAGRNYKQLTTEEKLLDIGKLITGILVPFWVDPAVFDDIIFGSVASIVKIKMFGGDLVFTHTCGFLVELARRARLFPSMDRFFEVKAGKNSQPFQDLCVATSERGCRLKRPTYLQIAAHVNKELGDDSQLGPDAICAFACKFIQILASIFTGGILGRERKTSVKGVKKFCLKRQRPKTPPPKPRATRLRLDFSACRRPRKA